MIASRIEAFGIVAGAMIAVFVWMFGEEGNSAFAVAGAVLSSLPVLALLSCKLDPCGK